MSYTKERRAAIESLLIASEFCDRVQKTVKGADVCKKRDCSPVSIADYGSQAIISIMLANAFPQDPILGEEDIDLLYRRPEMRREVFRSTRDYIPGAKEDEVLHAIDRCSRPKNFADRFWTLDPIDGTKGFLQKRHYAIALSLIEEGEVVLGVLACPNLGSCLHSFDEGSIYIAVKGEGAFMRFIHSAKEIPLRVSRNEKLSRTVICASPNPSHTNMDQISSLARSFESIYSPIHVHSQCKYALVARGVASLYYRLPVKEGYKEKIWDHAAGAILLEESGGIVTDCNGCPLNFSRGVFLDENYGIVATTSSLYEPVLSQIKRNLRNNGEKV